jgi:hypothetical protein
MLLTKEQIQGLNTSLEESNLLGIEVDPDRRIAAATFAVLTLPQTGAAPADRRVQFLFWPVGRVAASLRNGRWYDSNAEVVKFNIADLLLVVQSFNGLPIYGGEFFDVPEAKSFARWAERLSLDYRSGSDGLSHTLDLFQEGHRHLEIRLWFDEFEIRNPAGAVIPLSEFMVMGQRWWDGLYSGDPRTQGFGIFPLSRDVQQMTTAAQGSSYEPLEFLIGDLVHSLVMRDWDDEPDPEKAIDKRKQIMRRIVRIGEASIAPLVKLLQHSDWAVRTNAALMLGHIKDVRAVESLLEAMMKDESKTVKLSAASALERIGTQEVLEAVREWYHDAGISVKQQVQQKLDEYLIYGETDVALMSRIIDLARSKEVTPHQIVSSWLLSNLAKPRDPAALGGVNLSPEERAYLEEPYQSRAPY